MDFTRPSKYIKEFNNINDVVEDTVELLRNLFLEKRIEVSITRDENAPLVKSDFNQMKQVMLNLIQNSIDATPSGGSISLITEYDREFLTIRVLDNGSGIAEEDPNIVFEPFFTTKVTGVGLGLANVKKIIKDHSGTIEVRNREEAGVEFIIRLPVPT
jgi:signal transduction histidine kinase